MSLTGGATSLDVRVWSIRKKTGKRGSTYVVRWAVQGNGKQRTFTSAKFADSFRSTLLVASREGQGFDVETGLPPTLMPRVDPNTWFNHALAYTRFKWPDASPRYRKDIADALTTLTVALVREGATPGRDLDLRRALNLWAFNATAQQAPIPVAHAAAIDWIRRESLPLAALQQAAVLRGAVTALSTTLDGRSAAKATIIRKRATLNNALQYAVELGALDGNPMGRVKQRLAKSDSAIDRRIVVNPHQARALLAAVRKRDPALEGFFACLYYAGLRPAEARNVRFDDFVLPPDGWGSVVLTGSHQYSGSAWTDTGKADEERQLKHRSRQDIRRVPLHPELVEILKRHTDRFACGVSGRLFVTRTGRAGVPIAAPFQNPVSMGIVYSAWHRARHAALTPKQEVSSLARRPYDLRHACLSTWLNAGVPPAQVATWAGHGIEVLLRVYANCLDEQEESARLRIEGAFREAESGTGAEN